MSARADHAGVMAMPGDEAHKAAARWNRLFPIGTEVRVDGHLRGRVTKKAEARDLYPEAEDIFADDERIVMVEVEMIGSVSLSRVSPVELP